jgi:serine/threonine protein kinase
VTDRGLVKVLDFGVAKLRPVLPGDATTAASPAGESTQTGVRPGTFAYMSPEQIRGEEADGRSDIFALGILLYELLSGRHPFRRDGVAETIAAILRDDPAPLAGNVPHARTSDGTMPDAIGGRSVSIRTRSRVRAVGRGCRR